ncbi:MAG: NDP-sugar synthase [archaeon]|nr:NDP-sugar synthase [archaeon]
MDVKQAVIMVGGKGTRLYPLTENTPKPALPVLDMPCLKYLIRSFASAGISEVFLACGYKSDVLQKSIGDGSDLGVKIIYSDEETPLGTGGAMKQLESRLDPVFAAANGDTFIDIDLREQIDEHLRSGAKITIALTQVPNPCEYGIARVMDDGRITEFKDKPKPEEVFSNLINAGIYVVDRSVLSDVPETGFFDFSKDLVPIITNKGLRVQGYKLKGGVWKDVGRPSDLIGTNLLMAERLHSGDRFSLGDDVTLSGPFFLGEHSSVTGSRLDSVVILDDVTVTGSTMTNTLVLGGCMVSGAEISNSILGKGCRIGEGAVIRDSVLRDGTVVSPGEIIDRRVG